MEVRMRLLMELEEAMDPTKTGEVTTGPTTVIQTPHTVSKAHKTHGVA